MNFKLDLTDFENLSSKVLFESQRFHAKHGVSATLVFLDPKTFLILNYGCVKHNINGTNLEYGNSNIEKLYGIEVKVVPSDVELIEFGFRSNMETAMEFVNR